MSLVVPRQSFVVPKSAVPAATKWQVPGVGKQPVGYITDAPTPPDIPQPVGFRIIVQVFEARDKSEKGILFTEETRDAEKTLAMLGRVVAMGPDAYSDKEKFPNGRWVNVDDVAMFSLYSGHKFSVHGVQLRLMNDDEVLAVVPEPNAISRG